MVVAQSGLAHHLVLFSRGHHLPDWGGQLPHLHWYRHPRVAVLRRQYQPVDGVTGERSRRHLRDRFPEDSPSDVVRPLEPRVLLAGTCRGVHPAPRRRHHADTGDAVVASRYYRSDDAHNGREYPTRAHRRVYTGYPERDAVWDPCPLFRFTGALPGVTHPGAVP